MSCELPPIKIRALFAGRPVAMGQLTMRGVLIGMVTALSVVTTMTSVLTDRSSLRTAVYVFALKSGLGDVEKENGDGGITKINNSPRADFLQGGSQEVHFDGDNWLRKIRSETVRKHETAFKCREISHEMVPWARALVQTSDSVLEGTYYHVPRAAFIQKSTSPLALPIGLHIENMLEASSSADHHPRCHPQCPVRLRMLPPEPDRLWPRNLVVAECACKETPCLGRGGYQCRQVDTPVLIVRGLPGQRPRECPEMVPAGCQCIPVRTMHAAFFERFT